jgi:hypothetical protein
MSSDHERKRTLHTTSWMKEATTYGQPIASVVDLFIAVCTASGECNP